MSRETINCAVMFSDVAGSTALYDEYGDTKAKAIIENCLNIMAEITKRYKGVVIKTIGDEIMSRFPTAEDGVKASCSIQEAISILTGPDDNPMAVRIGIHAGEAILDDNDVFGDAVNVAARMAGIAKARQIITTEDTYNQLSEDLQEMAREFDTTSVKGKQDQITIYDIVWDEEDDVTRMSFTPSQSSSDSQITMTYSGQQKILTQADTPITIGRGAKADITIDAPLASRSHVRLDYNRGKFVLSDQSTNGTFIKLADGKEVYLRREELPLSSRGAISLGEKIDEASPLIISFEVS
ncbi:MAG: adenylate/guanylate cyclase domain-containing protein [Gammaproteobacteria bacterium]|nr:adenylate/guanylate cyclase domain-containing protein [Gammaproteobacteria bacterium]MCW8922507.1 adenylate/guanylate cyclase domain-containing protein [Gammaproteobacteria bacterium]